ncbi:hypothetical protein DAMA08_007930 [Martiniozyma asiatica (nom. inval.)]|nr:hypothetical protein DAMA08_007930 [Martiniozyma asiatica]
MKLAFVGLSSRSKRGCINCRKSKKKCDEVHPTCGLCKKRDKVCVWRDPPQGFDLGSIIQSSLMKSSKSGSGNGSGNMQMGVSDDTSSIGSSATTTISVSNAASVPFSRSGSTNSVSASNKKVLKGTTKPNPLKSKKKSMVNETASGQHTFKLKREESDELIYNDKTDTDIFNDKFNNDDVNGVIFKNINNIKSLTDRLSFKGIGGEESIEPQDSLQEPNEYPPMDESQLLENCYLNESELIKMYQSKSVQPFLRPNVHKLFDDSLVLLSRPHLSNLDTTAKLFLNHYITYLVNNLLDIGNTDFFLNHVLNKREPYLTNATIAWGGMFLVGRSHPQAVYYKELALSQAQSVIPKSKEDYINLLYFYIITLSSLIGSGSVNEWFQMLLHANQILNEYGGIIKFINENNTQEARWLISSFFYHDVLATRSLNFGTLIPHKIYHEIYCQYKFYPAGLDPFQGISNPLLLILSEILDKHQQIKGIEFPGPLIHPSREIWMHHFDSLIINSKPELELLSILPSDEIELHLTWYELMQISLRLYLRLSFCPIEKVQVDRSSLQSKGEKLFRILKNCKMKSLLCFPLLMLGILGDMNSEWEDLGNEYEMGNINKVWELVEHVKLLDFEVGRCIWGEVSENLGWNICLT